MWTPSVNRSQTLSSLNGVLPKIREKYWYTIYWCIIRQVYAYDIRALQENLNKNQVDAVRWHHRRCRCGRTYFSWTRRQQSHLRKQYRTSRGFLYVLTAVSIIRKQLTQSITRLITQLCASCHASTTSCRYSFAVDQNFGTRSCQEIRRIRMKMRQPAVSSITTNKANEARKINHNIIHACSNFLNHFLKKNRSNGIPHRMVIVRHKCADAPYHEKGVFPSLSAKTRMCYCHFICEEEIGSRQRWYKLRFTRLLIARRACPLYVNLKQGQDSPIER